MITYYPRILTHRRSQVEIDPGSPKVDFRMVLVLRSEELAKIAYIGRTGYSPPAWDVYRTAIVEGLNSAHGRGQRRQNKPVFSEVLSIGLKP